MHILVFPGWYPCRTDELSGDFVQRHIHAIASQCSVSVVFPVKDNTLEKTETSVVKSKRLTEYYYYYPSIKGIKWLDNFWSFIRYNWLCIKAARQLEKQQKVNVIHLYILQKNWLLGFVLKWLLKMPFVVSEQSTIYVDGSFEKMNFLLRKMYRLAFRKADSWHVVSNFLQQKIGQKITPRSKGIIIPNVVNTHLFYYKPHLNEVITFVHVSNMVHQKNVEGTLQAFAKVKVQNEHFILNLVGPLPSTIDQLINQLQLQNNVIIFGQKSYPEVAAIMQQSDVFVFFTRYETFGCVIIEANASGLPVIVSRLPVTEELITGNENGLFVENENIDDLASQILSAIKQPRKFNGQKISEYTAKRFGYSKIGTDFKNWYDDCLTKTPFQKNRNRLL